MSYYFGMINLLIYSTENGKEPFMEWLESLNNDLVQSRIRLRLHHITLGNFGNCKSVGDGVVELRIHIRPRYRVYYGISNNDLAVLLIGGNKSSQSIDIKKAKAFWKDWQGR